MKCKRVDYLMMNKMIIINPPINLPYCLSIHPSIYLPINKSIYLSLYSSFNGSMSLSLSQWQCYQFAGDEENDRKQEINEEEDEDFDCSCGTDAGPRDGEPFRDEDEQQNEKCVGAC